MASLDIFATVATLVLEVNILLVNLLAADEETYCTHYQSYGPMFSILYLLLTYYFL